MNSRLLLLLLALALLAGCATRPVSRSKLRQVELTTQTGPYAYLRSSGGGAGAR